MSELYQLYRFCQSATLASIIVRLTVMNPYVYFEKVSNKLSALTTCPSVTLILKKVRSFSPTIIEANFLFSLQLLDL